MDYRRDTSRDRIHGKRLRRLPINLPPLYDPDYDIAERVYSRMTRWKLYWLSHWGSAVFRGCITLPQYGRLHGVSTQAVYWLVRHKKLPAFLDTSGDYWVVAAFPYPESSRGWIKRKGTPDQTVRPLDYTDFRIVTVEFGQVLSRTPAFDELKEYARLRVAPRLTLAEQNARTLALPPIT